MRYILNTATDPYFNLAAEEWLLRNTDSDVFMLWRNAPAVIVGKNQNTAAEIDREFVEQRGVAVVRRLTGGGAVFHDLGNVNFTFLSLGVRDLAIDFARFTAPIVAALNAMGVPCAFDGRNDLVIDGLKFSGNAQHVEKDRVLHHGTLLFSAHMADLAAALKVNPEKYRDKAVKSVAKRVTNISAHLPGPMAVETFVTRLMDEVSGGLAGAALGLGEAERAGIGELKTAKYATWDWNWGHSPDYGFCRATRTPGGLVEVRLDVSDGVIRDARIYGDFFGVSDVSTLARRLVGCRHEKTAVMGALADCEVGACIRGVDAQTFVDCLF